ncbi:MAG: hypothetical protein QOH01_2836 [Verrucomicrobiota bacterium]|jgi:hypothetical protein
MSTVTPVRLFQNGIVFLCLLLPSIWMVITIPPLWRDLDAYVQLTENPLIVTFWGHAPAYSYVAKPFLFVGEHWERWRDSFNQVAGSSQPRLTDTGIWLLVISQHLALAAGAYYFIRAVSRFFWVRLALALLWASNALFYTYAHCLGSETLSLILITVLATLGLRLIQSRREPQWTDWYAFAVVLALCILSRDLNLGLISLLPAAFLLSWAQNRASIFGVSADRPRLWLRRVGGRYLRHAVVAMAIGLACVVIANSLKTNLARKTRFHPHSRIGFTFLWRLNFLDSLSPEARGILLRKVAGRTHSTEARQMIALVEQMKAEKGGMSAAPFMQRAILLFDGPKWEELDRALNKMAFAFLLPPTPEHLRATKNDLVYALKMPPTEIISYLFATTAYYFEHKDKMLQCANLVTFRDSTPEQITQLRSEHFYFRLWQRLNYHRVFVIWLVALVVFVFASRQSRRDGKAITAFGIALTAVGLLLCLTACLLDELEPRFASSMWQLFLLSIFLFLGKTADLIIEGKVRRAAVRPEP